MCLPKKKKKKKKKKTICRCVLGGMRALVPHPCWQERGRTITNHPMVYTNIHTYILQEVVYRHHIQEYWGNVHNVSVEPRDIDCCLVPFTQLQVNEARAFTGCS